MIKDRLINFTEKITKGRRQTAFIAIAMVIVLLATLAPIHISNDPYTGQLGLRIGDTRYITIGNLAYGQEGDYTCDGIADDVEFQQALDAAYSSGAQLFVYGGSYNWTPATTVTRAINAVSIIGVGASVYFYGDGSTPLFAAGGNNWLFSNLKTDAGGLNMGATTDWMWLNITVGSTYYPLRTDGINIEDHSSLHGVGAADTLFPNDPNADKYLKWDDDPGQLIWADAGGGDMLKSTYDTDDDGDIDTAAGGTEWDSSAATGVAYITAGAWGTRSTGISNTFILVVDDVDAADNDFAKFTAGGLEGRDYSEVRSDLGLVIGTDVQAYDSELAAIAGLTSATNKAIYFTGSGTAATTDFTAFARSILDDADEATFKATVNLEVGTDVQAYDAELAALAGTTSAADKLPYFTGSGTADVTGLSAFTRGYLDDADEATFKASVNLEIGTDVLAYQTIGIADDNLVEIDDTDAADNDYAKFTANGLEGRNYTEVLADLSGQAGATFDWNEQTLTDWGVESGATLDASPITGELFLHTPTGRKILYQYDGSNWQPIQALGDMTVYVDSSDGTDGLDYGFGVDEDAFETIQYAVNMMKVNSSAGAKSIYINNETYTEDVYIRGTGGWAIPSGLQIYGTLDVVDTGTATGGTQGSIDATPKVSGTFDANEYDNYLIKFTSGANDGLYRVIGLTTTTNICLDGAALEAQPQNGDNYTIYDWGTEIEGVFNVGPLTRIRVYDLAITRATPSGYEICIWGAAYAEFFRCRCSTTGTKYAITYAQACGMLDTCLVSVTGANYGIELENMGECEIWGTRFIGDDTSGSIAINIRNTSNLVAFDRGSEIEGFEKGIVLVGNSDGVGTITTLVSPDVDSHIHGCTYGVYTEAGGQLLHTEYFKYGVDLNGDADANTYDTFDQHSTALGYKTDAFYQYIPTASWTHVCLDAEDYDVQSEMDVSVVSGTADATSANKLHDTGQFTEAENYYLGRTVFNTTDNTYTTVTGKDSDDQLSITDDIMVDTETYKLYFSSFTATEAGRYMMIGSIGYTTTDTVDGHIYLAGLYVNSTLVAKNRYGTSANNQFAQCQASVIYELDIDDVVTLRTYHDTGSTVQFAVYQDSVSLIVYKLD